MNSTNNKRVLIHFHHGGRPLKHSSIPLVSRRQEIKDFLNLVWQQFGTVREAYYHRDFEYCSVEFQSSHQAIFALAGLQDPIQVQVAVQDCVGANTDRAALRKLLFIGDNPISADWAPPKENNKTLRTRN